MAKTLAPSHLTHHHFRAGVPLVPANSTSKPQLHLCCIRSSTTSAAHNSSNPDPRPDSRPSDLISLFSSLYDWADAVKERRVLDRREFYSANNWRDHRSSRRHIRHVVSSLSSRVILSLVPPVSALTAFAAALALYNSLAAAHGFLPVVHASPLPYQLTAPALALLLVFRTEASYSRFEEGRKAWTRVVAGAADLAEMVLAVHKPGKDNSSIRRLLLNYVMAFPVALKCHVISGSDVRADLQGLLDEDELSIVTRSKHRPHCIIQFISESIQILQVEEQKRNLMEAKLSCFHDGIGVCEHLMGIPIPLSYTRLTSRFLVLWHLTLPVILWDDCNWIVVPATFISAASLFSIEEVGVLIEEPFPMLALDELCRRFHDSVRDTIAAQPSVRMQVLSKVRSSSHGGNFTNGVPSGHKSGDTG